MPPRSFSGTLHVTFASHDSIAARWDVVAYAPQAATGTLETCLALPDSDVGPCTTYPQPQVANALPYQIAARVVTGTENDSLLSVAHQLLWRQRGFNCLASPVGITEARRFVSVPGRVPSNVPRP